jgi:hypothetical protein
MARRIDHVTRELCQLLAQHQAFEFKQVFDIIHERLRARDEHGVGEEMLRLRTYTRLQKLIEAKVVQKSNGKYRGDAKGLAQLALGNPISNPKYGRRKGGATIPSSVRKQ